MDTRRKAARSFTAYISLEGVTIPLEIREALEIKPGDLVKCRIKKVE